MPLVRSGPVEHVGTVGICPLIILKDLTRVPIIFSGFPEPSFPYIETITMHRLANCDCLMYGKPEKLEWS